jgi:hypothetical protein
MNKAKLYVGFILISSLLLSSFPSTVNACSCGIQSVEREMERSDAVFSGMVVNVREARRPGGILGREDLFQVSKEVHLQVKDTWKGVKEGHVIIRTGLWDGDCGIDFKVGTKYMVYATNSTMYGAKEALESTICNRTTELSNAKEDLEILGEGQPPSNRLYQVFGTYLIIGIVLILIIKTRKKV